jgi:hypothetical protein
MLHPWNAFPFAPCSNVRIGHNMRFLEICKDVVFGTLAMVTTCSPKVLLTLSTLQFDNDNPIAVIQL